MKIPLCVLLGILITAGVTIPFDDFNTSEEVVVVNKVVSLPWTNRMFKSGNIAQCMAFTTSSIVRERSTANKQKELLVLEYITFRLMYGKEGFDSNVISERAKVLAVKYRTLDNASLLTFGTNLGCVKMNKEILPAMVNYYKKEES